MKKILFSVLASAGLILGLPAYAEDQQPDNLGTPSGIDQPPPPSTGPQFHEMRQERQDIHNDAQNYRSAQNDEVGESMRPPEMKGQQPHSQGEHRGDHRREEMQTRREQWQDRMKQRQEQREAMHEKRHEQHEQMRNERKDFHHEMRQDQQQFNQQKQQYHQDMKQKRQDFHQQMQQEKQHNPPAGMMGGSNAKPH